MSWTMTNTHKIDTSGVLSIAFPSRNPTKKTVAVPLASGSRVLDPATLEFSDGTTLLEQNLSEKPSEKKVGRRIQFVDDTS